VLAIAALARIYGPEFIALAALLAIGVVAFVHARAMEGSNPRLAPALWLVSAIFFGWTIGFKALAWPAYLFVARAVPAEQRRRWLIVSLVVFVALCLPFFARNPAAFIRQILLGFTFHTNAWGLSIWSVLDHYISLETASLRAAPSIFAIVAVLGVAYLLWRRRPATLGEALAQAAVLLAVIVRRPSWSTSTYYTYAFAIVSLAVATLPECAAIAKTSVLDPRERGPALLARRDNNVWVRCAETRKGLRRIAVLNATCRPRPRLR
jgi:hypothetical protein